MTRFYHSMFKVEHKSYYTAQDVEMLDAYRSKPQMGILKKGNKDYMVEIDVRKAYTHTLTQMNEVPVFNEFDRFKPYDGELIQPYSLYIVKAHASYLFFQKTYSLCFGMFLQRFLGEVEVLAFKKPSFVKPVNYKKVVVDLYESKISQDDDEDKELKKLIANVNIGMLEKGTNKATKSYIFHTLEEAKQKQI